MRKKVKKGVMIGLGLAAITKDAVEKRVKKLQKQGKLNKKEARKFLNKVSKTAKTKQGRILKIVNKEVDKAFKAIKVAANKDLRKFEKRRSKKKKVKKKRRKVKNRRKKKR
jgi:polyhydroxyalkanoate synthesis regulator phasin